MTIALNPVRTPVVLPVAGAVTVGLFVLMNNLIDIGPVTPDPVVERPPVQIRFEPEPVRIEDRWENIEITELDPPPPVPRLDIEHSAVEGMPEGNSWTLPPIEVAGIEIGSGLANIDRAQPVPRVRIDPIFPASEASRGRSGECSVTFDITPEGRTTNIRPGTCTSRAFEQATMNAVSRWRYDPQVRNGEPVLYRNAVTQLVYNLDQ
ncbi:energy transducer TonB [Maricaulis parjimensis]|uniref:energy transducer TonB n=1 Tax=Maricaulis parjimensis TaxID=144023 RepID=UPI001939AB17|nr:energy transducer TonB [Maricaulis parjimensis]